MSMIYNPNEPKPVPRPGPDLPDSIMAMLSMKGKVTVISGSGSGIGLAATEALAEAGSDVAMWYNSNDKTIETAKRIAEKYGVKVKAYKVPVTDWETVHSAVQQVVADFGRLDVMIANAGVGGSGGLLDMSLEEWHKVVDVNYFGVVHCAKAAGEVFRKQGKGNLIITSSISAHIVNVPVDQPSYNSAKAGVTMLGKCLAREWREFARVNIISPGFYDTDMGASPQALSEAYRMSVFGRQGNVKELKGIFLYLASDASSFTTGTDVLCDGGYTLT